MARNENGWSFVATKSPFTAIIVDDMAHRLFDTACSVWIFSSLLFFLLLLCAHGIRWRNRFYVALKLRALPRIEWQYSQKISIRCHCTVAVFGMLASSSLSAAGHCVHHTCVRMLARVSERDREQRLSSQTNRTGFVFSCVRCAATQHSLTWKNYRFFRCHYSKYRSVAHSYVSSVVALFTSTLLPTWNSFDSPDMCPLAGYLCSRLNCYRSEQRKPSNDCAVKTRNSAWRRQSAGDVRPATVWIGGEWRIGERNNQIRKMFPYQDSERLPSWHVPAVCVCAVCDSHSKEMVDAPIDYYWLII